MRKMMQRTLSCLLTLAMVATMLMTSTLAAEKGAKLEFAYPDDVPEKAVTIKVIDGYPNLTFASFKALDDMEGMEKVNGDYVVTKPGIYTYFVKGDGYYPVFKMFEVTQKDIDAGTMKLDVLTGKMTNKGYEPGSFNIANAPENYNQNYFDIVGYWTDNIEEEFTTDGLKGYKPFQTPFYTNTNRGDHEFTSQSEMMQFLQARKAACKDMYIYNLGNSPGYEYEMPIAVFTTTDLSSAATLKDAAAKVTANGKLNVWVQAQIHPSEPAAGEGALALIDELTSTYGAEALKQVNVIVVPRINPDGSYLFIRANYAGNDMNRDHMALKSVELAYLHTAFRYFMPEVAADLHEFGGFSTTDGYMSNADDLQTTPASSLNNDAAVNELAELAVDRIHTNAVDAGLRPYHYGTTVNNPIGRAFYGLYNSISILIETRGIGQGASQFDRRVFSQLLAARSVIDYSVENSAKIKTAVANARANTILDGRTYDADDVVILHQIASGKTFSPRALTRYQYSVNGDTVKTESAALSMNDTIVRSRQRPTAYVIPADAANIDKILYIFDNQGFEYYKLDAGTTASLQQYYYEGEYTYDGSAKGITAGLRDTADVTFAKGAYVVPMDQVAGNVIAMLCEPDVNDSNGYDGTLYQYKQIDYDKTTKNFPLYRYTGNDPRTTLVSNGTSAEPTQPEKPAEEPTQPASGDTYTVVSGDSLWKIASKQLGSGSRWTEIYDLNKGTIKSPSVIFVGQILRMPLTAVSQ